MEDENSGRVKYRAKLSGRSLLRHAERYILKCHGDEVPEGERRFPNVAGFCRFLGISRKRYEELGVLYPEEIGVIEATFEDEALNSVELSVSLLNIYLKARLGYTESKGEKEVSATCSSSGGLKVIFEHDIMRDGE